MPYFQKPIDAITANDLQELVNQQVAEQKTLEYKRQLPGGSEKDKFNFLKDVSAFANAGGGDIIYGMEEKDGKAHELIGLENGNTDDSILWLENVIQPGIEPRIIGLQISAIDLNNGKPAIIIRIPRSWTAPHWVRFADKFQFFSRHSKGNYQLDLGELRNLFNLSESRVDKLRSFRLERLARIVADDMPIALKGPAKVVIHILPFVAFDPAFSIDLKRSTGRHEWWGPIDYWGLGPISYNFEGIFVASNDSSYLQMFRTGCIEVVGNSFFEPLDKVNLFHEAVFESQTFELLERVKNLHTHYAIEPPFYIACSVLGVKDYCITVNRTIFGGRSNKITRDDLLLPEVYVSSNDYNPHQLLRPVFDAIYNAAGLPQSPNYDLEGNWKVK